MYSSGVRTGGSGGGGGGGVGGDSDGNSLSNLVRTTSFLKPENRNRTANEVTGDIGKQGLIR